VVDTFSNDGPDREWVADDAINAAFEDGALVVTGTAANAALSTGLPFGSMRSAFTVAFDLLLPGGGAGLNQAQFAVVGVDQLAASGADRFGGVDRFLSFGTNSPQQLTNFGQWTANLLNPTVLDQWYHVWLVYDGSGQTVDFYAAPMADPVESVELPAEPAGTFALETAYADLSQLVLGLGLGANSTSNGMKVDNIYQALGGVVALTPRSDDPPPPPENPWQDVEALTGGFKQTGIGLIQDADYPYIWHVPTMDWLYIVEDISTADSIVGWSYAGEYWFWTGDTLQGWHYNFSDPDSGEQGWHDWTR
jgi:hypothetical protein